MRLLQNRRLARVPRVLILAAGIAAAVAAEALPDDRAVGSGLDAPALLRTLARIHPDYRLYVSGVRALAPGIARRIYMALVRPGAADPDGRESAPYAGPGARNDIVYDEQAILEGHSEAFRCLLLDHEYFHARHLAGGTVLPLASGAGAEIERHFNEAAAWGFNVAEARAGRYPGLRPDEFREALDRQGEHYAALKALMKDRDPGAWARVSDLLHQPSPLVTTSGSRPSADRSRLFDWGRSPAIP